MLDKIKSIVNFKEVTEFITKRKYLKIFINNKKLQTKLNISIDTYIEYYNNQIEIEIIPDMNKLSEDDNKNKFINIKEESDKSFYHIYFDESNEEIEIHYINKNEKISRIKVIIDMEVKSLANLFKDYYNIKEIKFIKFNRTDYIDYSYMFSNCKKLNNLDISKLKTDNVKNMNHMFNNCSSLKNLNLSNFQTDKVIDISYMFDGCSSLESLDLSNFNTNNIKSMEYLFSDCRSLKALNISNFIFNEYANVEYMFRCCSQELKNEIRNEFKNLNESAFYEYLRIKTRRHLCGLDMDSDISN